MRVRVVEDNPDIAALLRFTLEKANGFTLEFTTDNFSSLLTPAPWEDIDAALVDVMLPETSGLEILRYLRDVHPNIRRVAMTAAVNLAADAQGIADAVIVKPFHTADVVRALR